MEGAVDGAGYGFRQHRLADAGDVLDQQVPFGYQCNEGQPYLLTLSAYRLLDVGFDRLEERGERVPICGAADRSLLARRR